MHDHPLPNGTLVQPTGGNHVHHADDSPDSSDEVDPYDPQADNEADDPFILQHNADQENDVVTSASPSAVDPISSIEVPPLQEVKDGETEYVERALANLLLRAHATETPDVELAADLGALLALSVHEGRADDVSKLLEARAAVDFPTASGATPLHLCCQGGHVNIARLLLDAGGDFELCMPPGLTPLYVAAINGREECVRLLLNAKASLCLAASEETCPLHAACQEGHLSIVKLLLDAARERDRDHPTWAQGPAARLALLPACERGATEVVRVLLESGWPIEGSVSSSGYPPLYIAAMNGYAELVNLLIERNAPINEVCCDCSHALLAASQDGHVACVRALVAARADLDLPRDTDGATALYVASESNHLEVVMVLIDAKASLEVATTEDGSTPLIVAAQNAHLPVLERLLEAGADCRHQRNSVGKQASPVYVAAINGHADVVRRLIEAQADVDVPTIDNETPLFAACREGFADIAKLLMSAKADVTIALEDSLQQPIHAACEVGTAAVVEQLLDCRAAVDSVTADEASPLLVAAQAGAADVVRLLLDRRADPNAQVSEEQEFSSVLAAACLSGTASDEAVRWLLEVGARPAPGHRAKQTLVAETRRHGRTKIADLLLQHLP